MTPDRIVDAEAHDQGSLLAVYPQTARARRWLRRNVDWPSWQQARGMVACEHRYGPELLGAMLRAGLYVTLDGREPRAEFTR